MKVGSSTEDSSYVLSNHTGKKCQEQTHMTLNDPVS